MGFLSLSQTKLAVQRQTEWNWNLIAVINLVPNPLTEWENTNEQNDTRRHQRVLDDNWVAWS